MLYTVLALKIASRKTEGAIDYEFIECDDLKYPADKPDRFQGFLAAHLLARNIKDIVEADRRNVAGDSAFFHEFPNPRSRIAMRFAILNDIKQNVRVNEDDHADPYLRVRSSSSTCLTCSSVIDGNMPSA